MHNRLSANLCCSSALLFGLTLFTAGCTVPSEPTIAIGLFLLFAAITCLIGLNYPQPGESRPLAGATIHRFPGRAKKSLTPGLPGAHG
ncbi:hypothetical protein [Sphingomonas morindae]|uniref:Lipoprotein n=1 Tax=Sphingomonas morindae TaxID=1541170 RepID=A0ABY4X854_9SPHN|nr:hypothetical protein [Sphingomonas morindae]USI73054.1 hypothetical protein LHA26_00820 [Sphingomonas morindae]